MRMSSTSSLTARASWFLTITLLLLVMMMTPSPSIAFAGSALPKTFLSTTTTAAAATTTSQPLPPSSSSSTSLSAAATTTTATTSTTTSTLVNEDVDFIKPEPDRRQYRAIRLSNGLQVLLVSAPDSDVEAGSIHVQAGHMDDPDDRAGLAHFHEHMLFLGTEKYPEEKEYQDFLSQNGGSSNAYTDMEDTNYYFSVTTKEHNNATAISPALLGALDRLAQFFIAPRFDRSMVDREMRAIDSEYRNGLTSDAWRNAGILKASCDPHHPFSKFGCGNYQTLTQGGVLVNATHTEGIQSLPVEDLLDFWDRYYRTYNMRLCVVGQGSLDALQRGVEETFGQLPPSEGQPRRRQQQQEEEKEAKVGAPSAPVFTLEHAQYDPYVAAFGPAQLGKLRHIQPLTESRTIKLLFATPPLDDPLLKGSKPHRVISHLIGHEAPGSLHAVLNEEGLITGLSSGTGIDTSDFSLFSVTISLTTKGMEESDRVLDLFFQWISQIGEALQGEEGLMKAYHDEIRRISDVNFRFRENGNPTTFSSSAARALFSLEPSKILSGAASMSDYDPTVTKLFFERLVPENAMINVYNSDFSDSDDNQWETEQWYGAKYKIMDITEEQRAAWKNPTAVDERLQLPELNKFIPTHFHLRADGNSGEPLEPEDIDNLSPPTILEERPGYRMWHKLDRTWRVPKAAIRLALLSPEPYRSPRTMTQNRIFEKVLNDDLNSYVYSASLAGCHYSVSVAPSGYRISVRGYSEKLPVLLDAVTSRILTLIAEMKEGNDTALELKFQKAKESLLRQSKNHRVTAPYKIAGYNSRTLLEETVWHIDNYITELEDERTDPMTMQECAEIAEQSLRGPLRAEAFCAGNIDEDETRRVSSLIAERFLEKSRPLADVEMPVFRALELPTVDEAKLIFGSNYSSPLVYQEVAFSESEENNALELIFQCGCEHTLGYEGVAMLSLLAQLAYNSAYNQLRTREQLGYIVSAQPRRVTGKAWSFVVLVQSSVAGPSVLEERSEAWLQQFRTQLEELPNDELLSEAGAVVAQLLGRTTGLGEESSRSWGEIMDAAETSAGEPNFDRVKQVAETLQNRDAADIRSALLDLMDKHLVGPERRVLSSRVYSQKSRQEHDENEGKAGVISSFEDVQVMKKFLGTYPLAPYWIQKISNR